MTMQEQYEIAEAICKFIKDSGFTRKHVAQQCNINETVFSSWLNHNRTITEKQLKAVTDFVADYEQRMS